MAAANDVDKVLASEALKFPEHLRLTRDEVKELCDFPLGSINARLPLDRLNLRREIAKKFFGRVLASERFLAQPQRIKDAMLKYPMWGFYTDPKHTSIVRRVEGVCEYKDRSLGLRTVSAMLMMAMANRAFGGVAFADVVQVDDWSEEQLMRIALSGAKPIFHDPCGFMLLGGGPEKR